MRIAGRCTVFAESDMIAKQQYGFSKSEIIKGLCEALVRNLSLIHIYVEAMDTMDAMDAKKRTCIFMLKNTAK